MCDNPVTGKAVTCSPSCRKKLSRQKLIQRKDPQLPETLPTTPDRVEQKLQKEVDDGRGLVPDRPKPTATRMTPADLAWWKKHEHMGADWPSWLAKAEEHTCDQRGCGKKFMTQLRLLRWCELHI